MLPTFLVIGSQKAGTTSIYNVLKKHPQIFMPETKEINFFFHEYLYSRGIEFYELYFNSEKSDVIGEASPGYICHPEAPRRIKKHLPNVKLILTVRNPIDRAYSQYYDNRRQLSETRPFHQTLFTALSDEYSPGECGYFSRGIYIKYIKRYLEYFHHDQLLILLFEDLLYKPKYFFRKCLRFLEVDDSFECPEMELKFNPLSIWSNPFYMFFFRNPKYCTYLPLPIRSILRFGKRVPIQKRPIDQATKMKLLEFYKLPNRELAQLLGSNLAHWNDLIGV